MQFTVSGSRVDLTAGDIERTASRLTPDPLRTHVVVVGGQQFPVKQVFAAATGIDVLDFTTNQARRVLSRLGFELRRVV